VQQTGDEIRAVRGSIALPFDILPALSAGYQPGMLQHTCRGLLALEGDDRGLLRGSQLLALHLVLKNKGPPGQILFKTRRCISN